MLLEIFEKGASISAPIRPFILPLARLLIHFVLANINIASLLHWFPSSSAIAVSLTEATLIWSPIWPNILPFSMEPTLFVLSAIGIPIGKPLYPKAMLHRFIECSIVELLIWNFENSFPFFFTFLPFTFVAHLSWFLIKNSEAMLFAFFPLPLIDIAINVNQSPWPIFLTIEKLSLIIVLLWNILKTFSILFPLSILILLPSSNIKFPIKMPNNCFLAVWASEDHTVLILFQKNTVLVWYFSVKCLEHFFGKFEQVWLSDIRGRRLRYLRNLKRFYFYFRNNYLRLRLRNKRFLWISFNKLKLKYFLSMSMYTMRGWLDIIFPLRKLFGATMM